MSAQVGQLLLISVCSGNASAWAAPGNESPVPYEARRLIDAASLFTLREIAAALNARGIPHLFEPTLCIPADVQSTDWLVPKLQDWSVGTNCPPPATARGCVGWQPGVTSTGTAYRRCRSILKASATARRDCYGRCDASLPQRHHRRPQHAAMPLHASWRGWSNVLPRGRACGCRPKAAARRRNSKEAAPRLDTWAQASGVDRALAQELARLDPELTSWISANCRLRH